jgi:FKBP-type peptidyl-prolyl cis-trans isomerase FkpA
MLKSRILFVAFIAVCFFTACKNDPPYSETEATQAKIDDGLIKAYLDSNKIKDVIKGPKGLYYKVLTPGTDKQMADSNSYLSIHYVGRLLLNQVVFDSTATNDTVNSTKFILKNSIEGWQLGIPLVTGGGRLRLIVPSPLAYQNRQISTLIIPNTILDFDIQLIRVTQPISSK